MTALDSAIPFPRFGDVAHVGHVELFTPQPEESLAFFTSVVGLHETGTVGRLRLPPRRGATTSGTRSS